MNQDSVELKFLLVSQYFITICLCLFPENPPIIVDKKSQTINPLDMDDDTQTTNPMKADDDTKSTNPPLKVVNETQNTNPPMKVDDETQTTLDADIEYKDESVKGIRLQPIAK